MMNLTFGQVFETNLKLSLRQYLPAFLLTLLVSFIPAVLWEYKGIEVWRWIFNFDSPKGFFMGIVLNWKLWLLLAAYLVLTTFAFTLQRQFAAYVALGSQPGKSVSVTGALMQTLHDLPVIFPTYFKYNLIVLALTVPGFVLFMASAGLMPGVYFIAPLFGIIVGPIIAGIGYFSITCMYLPFPGIMAREKLVRQDAMDLASELTEGKRGKIFGLMLTFALLGGFLFFIAALVLTLLKPEWKSMAQIIGQALAVPFLMYLPTVVYQALRSANPANEEIANVFA
jgi:MFS family permease